MTGFHWLASYPKSGNTWLRLALGSLAAGGKDPDFSVADRFAPVASDRAALDQFLDVDSADLSDEEAEMLRPRLYEAEAGSLAGPKLLKVHDAWITTAAGEPLFPPALTLAAIYVVRDPRDVAVSLALHLGMDLDRTIAFMARADAALAVGGQAGEQQLRQRLSSWSGHVTSWRAAPRMLLLRYEDMLADPAATLQRAARHLGRQPMAEAIGKAVAATRFETLQAAEARQGFLEKARPDAPFFRRGIAGGWRDTLTARQAARIEADHGDVMGELGYR